MKLKVAEYGVTVPRRMLGDADEVEIRVEDGRIVIEPVRRAEEDEGADPIFDLGQNPVRCGVPDASEGHDHHLYG